MTVQNLSRRNSPTLTFPYVLQSKGADKDAKKIIFITDKKNPMKIGDLFFDTEFWLGGQIKTDGKTGVKLNPEDSVTIVAMRVDKILEERKAKGDYSFSPEIDPFYQEAICTRTEVQITAQEAGIA